VRCRVSLLEGREIIWAQQLDPVPDRDEVIDDRCGGDSDLYRKGPDVDGPGKIGCDAVLAHDGAGNSEAGPLRRAGRLLAEAAHDRAEPRILATRIPAIPQDPGAPFVQLYQSEPRIGATYVAGKHDHVFAMGDVSRAAAARSRNQAPRRAN
jgi:hypothetical protein